MAEPLDTAIDSSKGIHAIHRIHFSNKNKGLESEHQGEYREHPNHLAMPPRMDNHTSATTKPRKMPPVASHRRA